MPDTDQGEIRVDKWLWAARFYKTRALAAAAVAGGKVKVNGERAKPAKDLRVGDMLSIHIGVFEYLVRVTAISARRGPAAEAVLLYAESDESKARRMQLATQLAAERGSGPIEQGRPNKRVRRERIRYKQRTAD